TPKLLLLRESLITGLIGLVFVGSALIGRPLIYVLARASLSRRSIEDRDEFDEQSEKPEFRRVMTVMTIVWGLGLVAETGIRTVLVFSLPVGRFLIFGPVVGYATIGLLMLWTFLYVRRAEQQEAARDER
ncbi:MAG TPA: VC0807 family protein, partial [Acetobacteraceae bacterium]|nr:VC0807 family protein [Acetobacteraceae bacterium]